MRLFRSHLALPLGDLLLVSDAQHRLDALELTYRRARPRDVPQTATLPGF
ncbi:MAG: hypothetical protein JO239_13645 [Paraburkholderia sp.]|nr:hypothetical protein [Paraburkholderia sp.]